MTLDAGTNLEPYETTGQIGAGGMREEQKGQNHVTFLLNFFGEVRRRVAEDR